MDEFLSSIGSVYWWISVVIVGVVLNILSAYFRDWLDKLFFRGSSWWANRSKTRREANELLVSLLLADKMRFINYQFWNIRNHSLTNFYLLVSMVSVAATLIGRVFLSSRGFVNSSEVIRWASVPLMVILFVLLVSSLTKQTKSTYIISQVLEKQDHQDNNG